MPHRDQNSAPEAKKNTGRSGAAGKGKANPEKQKKSRLSPKEKRGIETLLVIVVLSLALYVVIMLVLGLFIWYYFATPATSASLYSITAVDAETETRLFSYSAGRANNSYGLYLSYKDLANYCDFGIAGDDSQVTIFFSEKDSIVCYKNSSLLSVNGNTVRISAPVLFEEDDYLLPVSLFESYLTGVEVTYDTANKVCRIAIPENPVFRLTMDRPAAMEQCNEYDLRTVAGDDMSGESSSGN